MKASFKKLTLLVYHRQRQHIIEMLQDLGVLHIDFKSDFQSNDIDVLEQQKTKISKTVEIIGEHAHIFEDEKKDLPEQPNVIANQVLELKHRIEALAVEKDKLLKEKLQRIPWNDFDLAKIERLRAKSIHAEFCVAGKKEYKTFDFSSLIQQKIYTSSSRVYFVVISKSEIPTNFETLNVPKRTLSDIIKAEEELNNDNEKLLQNISSFAPCIPLLKQELHNIENKINLVMAQGSFSQYQKGSLLSLTGWYPLEVEQQLVARLKKQELSFATENPSAADHVPVMLKNRSYTKLFEPIAKIFELPNYHEWDPTPLIAVFYPIMFAYCLGDAGYGLVFFMAALIGWFTFLKDAKKLALLGIVLGLMTTVMGLVKSGSVFGIPTNSEDWELFQALGAYVLIPDDSNFIFNAFNVALMIGVVQIFLGIFVSIYNKLRYEHFSRAIWQIGKLFIVTGLIWIFLADMQEVEVLQQFGILRNMLLVGGVLLVLFFHDMEKSLGARAASGFLPLFFIFTGILGDVLSYVRLFALGVASSVLGLVVNQIGMQIMENSWWGLLIGIVFLIFGHTLNFCIAILGSFVHPLRLTFVEFYNNAQFKGGGKAYQPFKKQQVEF